MRATARYELGKSLSFVREHMIRFGLYIALLAAPQFAWAFSVSISATLEGGDRPTVVGKTNLPDGMELVFRSVNNWHMYCIGFRYLWNGRYRNAHGTTEG